MRYYSILLYLLPIIGIFKEVSAFTFFLNKYNYQYYYNQLNNVERNIYNSLLNNIDNIILENDFVYLNTTSLIQSTKSSHSSEFSTYQNLYLIFEKQLSDFRIYFNNAKNAARYDYPELSFIDWDALDIDYYKNGQLILVHKTQEKTSSLSLLKSNLNDTSTISDSIDNEESIESTDRTITANEESIEGVIENTYSYIYKGLTNNSKNKRESKDIIKDYINEQTEFIYYDIIKDAFVDVPIVVGSDYYWTVASLNNGINTIINNVIKNIYNKVKSFDTNGLTYDKKNITDYEYRDRNAEEVYGLFKSGYATSVNLAKTFKLAMDYIGIKCVLVWGRTTDNVKNSNMDQTEMWNAIKIFDEWYSIDLAFNYYKICKVDSNGKRGLKLNTFIDCQVQEALTMEIDEEKFNKNNTLPYTLFGSEIINNYLIEDSTVFTSSDTYLIFPKLSQQNYDLYMDIKTSYSNFNITLLNDMVSIDPFKNSNIHSIMNEKEEIDKAKRRITYSGEDDIFVNINIKSIDYKMNNKDLIENVVLSYDVFSETFDVDTMSYLLVKKVEETSYVKMYSNGQIVDTHKRKREDEEEEEEEIINNNINLDHIKSNVYLGNVNQYENNIFFDDTHNRFTTLGMTELNGILQETQKKPVFYNNMTTGTEVDINLTNNNNNNTIENNNKNKNYNSTKISIDNVIYPEEYTYVPITKNYTSYQFIPGHSFININSEYASNQYITFYMTSVPISYWYNIFGENFSIGKEGFEEVVENGNIVIKEYNDWSNFINEYKDQFQILHKAKYEYHDASPPLTQNGVTINYQMSSPLPNYYINLKTSNITICFNQPLIKTDEELSIEIKYSIIKPLLNKEIDKDKVNYAINNVKFDDKTNCVNFEFIPDFNLPNIIYHFYIHGLETEKGLAPVDFSYIIYPDQDYEHQRTIYYQSSLTDKSPLSKLSYSIPEKDGANLMYYDGYNNIFYPHEAIILSKSIKEETKEKMNEILLEKEAQYNATDINTEFLTEITIKSTTGISLKSTSSLEILIPWTDDFKPHNYNTYKCYLMNKNAQGQPSTLSNCNLKFYSHGLIAKIRSSQFLWIISYNSESNNSITQKKHKIYYSTYIDVIKESNYEDNSQSNSKSQDKGVYGNEFKATNSSLSIDSNEDNQQTNSGDICNILDDIYSKKATTMSKTTEKVVIDNKYNCYFNLKTKFKYYCHNLETNEIITSHNGKCCVKEKKEKEKSRGKKKNKKVKHINKNKNNNRTSKRDYLYSLENGNLMMTSSETLDIDVLIPNNALESTLVYFSVSPPKGHGVKNISIINKNTGELLYTNTKDIAAIECISMNRSYRFVMPSTDIEISVDFASNNLKVEYIIIDDYQIDIVENRYFYYAIVKDKNDITEKPIVIKTENPYVTYNISYFILNEEIYITFIAPNNEYTSYTIRYVSKNDFADRSSVSMFYIDKKPLIEYSDNSYIFIYCNSDESVFMNDILDKITIKDLGTANVLPEIQGNKVLVNIIAENNYNSTLYTIVPLNKSDKEFSLYCLSNISDNNLNSEEDNNNNINNNNKNNENNNNTSSAYSIRSKYINSINTIFILAITFLFYIFI